MTPEIILHTNYRPSMELSAQDIGKHMKRLKLNDARGISTKGQRSRLRDMNTYETSLQDRFKQDASQKAEVSLKDEEFTSVDNPVLSFFGPATKNVIKRSERFTEQEYNLYEYGRIIDTEALVARTFTKKKGLMFRNGYELSSKNKKNIDYIEKRFREIAMVSKRPWQVILDELATSMISLHNSFYVKVRKETASSGKERVDFNGKRLKPIAGIFVVPAETMVQKIDDAGNVHLYRQWMPRNKWRDFDIYNVGHMFYNKRPGYTIGTPCLEPVRDDILALRRIEECVEKLIYKSLFPIIHVKVGTEKHPCKTLPDGTNEVDIATRYLEQMEEDGGLATNERVEIKAIGAESLALRISEYLNYFKNRVYAGLGMSGMDFGEASQTTKSSGEVLSQALADQVADYQKTFEQFMNVLIMELLLERGDYKNELDVEEKDIVSFVFNPIDKSEKIAKESHILSLANAGLLMIDEAREELDYAERKFDPEKTVPFLLQQASGETDLENQKQLVSHTAKVMPKPAAGGAKKPAAKKPAAKTTSIVKEKASSAAKSAAQKAKPANKKKLKDLMMSDDPNKQSRIARVLRDCAADHLTYGMYETFAELEQDIEASLASKIMDSSLDMAINLMVESLAFQSDESCTLLVDSVLEEHLLALEGDSSDEDQ